MAAWALSVDKAVSGVISAEIFIRSSRPYSARIDSALALAFSSTVANALVCLNYALARTFAIN
jgi:hypothetical protein